MDVNHFKHERIITIEAEMKIIKKQLEIIIK